MLAGLLLVAAIAGCRATDPTVGAVRGAITLRDSSAYEGGGNGGSMARMFIGEQFVDSVDLDFGVWTVGRDSLLFLPVRAYGVDGDEGGIDIDRHVLYVDGSRTPIDTVAPYFYSAYSSPSVVGRQVIYWGLRSAEPLGRFELYAARYVTGPGRVDTISLGYATMATDARFHLPPPAAEAGQLFFRSDSGTFVVDSSFRTVKRR